MNITLNKYVQIMTEYEGNEELPTLVEYTEKCLESDGVEFGEAYLNTGYAGRLILLAEAVNWAAKTISDWYYGLKPQLIVAAANEGAKAWSNTDEYDQTTYYLYTPSVGTASFHDPNDEVFYQGIENTIGFIPDKHWPWSGIYRQGCAFALLTDEDLLKQMANATRPRNLERPETTVMDLNMNFAWILTQKEEAKCGSFI